MCVKLACTRHLYYLHAESKILKAAKVANGSTSGKVVSFSWRPVMDKTESPLIA